MMPVGTEFSPFNLSSQHIQKFAFCGELAVSAKTNGYKFSRPEDRSERPN